MYSYRTLLFCQAVPSVRGFLLKDLKQCLRKEHCDVSEIQAYINLVITCVIRVYIIHPIVTLLFFLTERLAYQLKRSGRKGTSFSF